MLKAPETRSASRAIRTGDPSGSISPLTAYVPPPAVLLATTTPLPGVPAPHANHVAPIHGHQGAERPVSIGSGYGNDLARRGAEHIHLGVTNRDHHRTLEVQPVGTKIDLFVEGSPPNLRRRSRRGH